MNPTEFISQFPTVDSPIKGVRLPEIKITDSQRKEFHLGKDCSNFDFLNALCKKGFDSLGFVEDSQEYNEYSNRLKYELGVLDELGFVDYILLVWDVVNFCKENNIPTGPGRGSAAGSLVLYLIGVTKVDSLKYGLYFERFVSKTRAKKTVVDGITYLDGSLMPDVDIDFDYYQRHKVLDYVNQKYPGKTSKILTSNTLSSKLVIKEVGKVLGMKEEEEMTYVTSLIPKSHGIVEDLRVARDGKKNNPEDVEKNGEWKVSPVPEFIEWCNQNPLVYHVSCQLEGLIKNKGVHPSGILVSYDELNECCPTELSSDKEIVSGYDMNWVSAFSVKLDALGLRSVSVVDDCRKSIPNKKIGVDENTKTSSTVLDIEECCKLAGIRAEDIDINDPSIYQALQDLKYPHGLFQIEADTNFRVTQKVKPKNIEELAAVLALARPGALQFVDKYASFTNTGTIDTNSGSDALDKILAETGGCCIFQETMMRCCKEVFGLSLEEAELVRRACGKKKVEEMKKFEKVIKDNAKERNIEKAGEFFWNLMLAAADYSFNKSHALAYAILSAQTIYLKFNYPTQFYLSLLKMTKNEPDPIGEIAKIHKEMIAFGVELLPPSLTLSDMDFCIEGKHIRFGLSSIKGISEKTMEKLDNFQRRHADKFKLFASAKEAGLSIGVVSALVQAGTLDSLSKNRVLMVYEAQLWNILTDNEKKLVSSYAGRYEDNIAKTVKALAEEIKDGKDRTLIKTSRFETIKKRSERYKLIYQQNKVSHDFANWWYENRLLGYTPNKRLIDIFKSKKQSLEPISTIKTLQEKARCDFIGVVCEPPKVSKSKNGNPYAKFIISDETGTMKVMIFKDKMEQCKVLNSGLPQEGDIVIVCGTRMDEDTVFADSIASQQNKIYTKLSELKEEK